MLRAIFSKEVNEENFYDLQTYVLKDSLKNTAKSATKKIQLLYQNATTLLVQVNQFAETKQTCRKTSSLIKPFPTQKLTINDQTAKVYTEMLFNRRSAINLYKIRIDSCICDGNIAQKKAFSFAWSQSM